MSDDKPMTDLDTMKVDMAVLAKSERLEADVAILSAVMQKDALLPGQRDALHRLHDYLSARLADAEQPAVAGDGGLRMLIARAENAEAEREAMRDLLMAERRARAALSTSVPAGVVGIKPLEWLRPYGTEFTSIAETVVGEYKVWTHHEADGVWFGGLRDNIRRETTEYPGEDEAKAAAQTDYETRIRAALTQDPTR